MTLEAPGVAVQPVSIRKVDRLLKVVLVCGAIASLVSVLLFYVDFRTVSTQLGLTHSQAILVPNSPNLFQAVLVDAGSKMMKPLQVDGVGTAHLTDAVRTDAHAYYIVSDQTDTSSNVYEGSVSDPKKGLIQLTHSTTIKYGLSYDEQSGTIAYTAQKEKADPMIVVVSMGSTTEKVIGKGSNPTLLKGGFFVVYEREHKLYSYNIGSGKEYALLDIPKDGSYAVDGKALTAVISDPESMTRSYYSLKGMLAASAIATEKIMGPRVPYLLGLDGDTHVSAFATDTGLVWLRTNGGKQFFIPGAPYKDARITFIHD